MNSWSLLLLLLLLLPLSPSIAQNTITPISTFKDGQTLISPQGDFALGFFSPTNSKDRYLGIWYNKVSVQTVVWVANRANPISNTTGALKLSNNGVLSIYNHFQEPIWSANSSSPNPTNPAANLMDNGNLVVTDGDTILWQSFDHPCDTLLPGMKLGWDLTTGLDRYLTTWESSSDPSLGDFTFRMDPHGSPEFFILDDGKTKIYRNGPWNGIRFSGEPEMESDENFNFNFTSDPSEIYYSFQIKNSSIISRFVLNQSMIQRYVWLDSKLAWNLYWSIPRETCDNYGQCGPYGVCDLNNSPVCSCVRGFTPKSPHDWNFRDGSGGCVRRTSLDCVGGSDGFLKMKGMKLPDTSNVTVNQRLSLDECKRSCLENCLCTAYAGASIIGGVSGCIIWTGELVDLQEYVDSGQDLYVRLAASELGSSKKKKEVIAIVVSIVTAVLLLWFAGYCIKRRKKKYGRNSNRLRQFSFELASATTCPPKDNFRNEERNQVLELPLLDIDSIMIATNNFSSANKLGEGGYGAVYKGDLDDKQSIAVKRLSKTSMQGPDEFKNEVSLIAKLQHINLVRLLGCCIEGEERILIYEYMHNRSLDTIIFGKTYFHCISEFWADKSISVRAIVEFKEFNITRNFADKSKSELLSWPKRLNIISGIARGLLYLHQDSRFRVIHRDLKASNILLDKDMNAKISDFGVARIFGGGQDGDYTKRVVGTYGYMSPEYAMDGIFSVKSDVYSFGVLVLEIISGQRNRAVFSTEPHLNLLSHAWRLWKEGDCLELIDKSIDGTYTTSEVMRCIQVALLCVQESAEDRPHMSMVILMLGSASAMLPQPKPPGFWTERWLVDTECSTSQTINEITVTLLKGR